MERPAQSHVILGFEAKRKAILEKLGTLWATSEQITGFLPDFVEGEVAEALREGSVPAVKIGGVRNFLLLSTGAPSHSVVSNFQPTSAVTHMASALRPTSEPVNR
jgi:hypothetical protein